MARVEQLEGARPATLTDVAQTAGVSVATASKALNGRPDVAERTRRRVLEVAERLAFAPNETARNLLSGRTGTVGLLTSDLDGRFVLPILMGAEDALGAGQVNAFLCDARGDVIREQHHLRALLSRRVDGIIVVGARTDPRESLGSDLPVPVVYVYSPSESEDDLSYTPDNVGAGRIAVEHLVSTGRKRIAHITGENSYDAARDRARGVLEGIRDAGLEPVGEPLYSSWSERWGRDAAGLLLSRHTDVDAIVCGSDQIARGVLDTLRDLKRDVPDDIAVIGFDNWEVLAANSRPELTSIDANLQNLGRAAALSIFDAIDQGSVSPGLHRLPTRLVIRSSTIARR